MKTTREPEAETPEPLTPSEWDWLDRVLYKKGARITRRRVYSFTMGDINDRNAQLKMIQAIRDKIGVGVPGEYKMFRSY